MNKLKSILFALFLLPFSFILNAQEEMTGRIPEYEIPYVLPTVDGIKEVLNRVKEYYESTSPQTIIDSKTGKMITDFKTFNPNAEPSPGFSSEWSYTHGVVLSAFDYITKVTGDKSFFDNNIKFYDYVIENLLYFQNNSDKKQ